MNGYVAQRRGRCYAVIYEGLDPVTGRERRTWHPAGPTGLRLNVSRRGWPWRNRDGLTRRGR